MVGTGTLINVAAIVAGGFAGLAGKRLMNEKLQDTLMKSTGLCTMFIGISGALEKMMTISDGQLSSGKSLMIITSFALGALIGEGLNIEERIESFGEWLKRKSGNANDQSFVNAFVTASFTVCIGAMAIVGSIQDGMSGDPSTLMMKAILDFLIIMVMTASMGKGCIFSAIPVGIFQGTITILASVVAPLMTEGTLNSISLVGSMLIFCVGVNLIWEHKLKVANMLPAIVIAAIWGAFLW
ncbi:MAG: DUF554 domain-containing protein [Lachnospiraceae bacterium]|nr:DUF554 domain-containing protein [Lachnospiraceae bacterium]